MPKKAPNRAHPNAVQLRFSDDEFRALVEEADDGAITVTALIRRVVLGVAKLSARCKEKLATARRAS
jgi:hypothetical protein